MTHQRRDATESDGPVMLDLLDGFRLSIGSERIDVSDMAQRLVAFVALHRRPLHRALVAGTLWPEKAEHRASANLRSCLWRLNDGNRYRTIVSTGSSLALHPGVNVDVVDLERHGWALIDGAPTPVTRLATTSFSHELLPGWYEDWVIIERERLGQLQIRFLEALVDKLRDVGDFARAIDHAMRLVAIDPLRERSQFALIHALADEGSWGRACRQAAEYRLLMTNTFACPPTATFTERCEALLPSYRDLVT
jgi:DNA-binding SARP family transcriptional activator